MAYESRKANPISTHCTTQTELEYRLAVHNKDNSPSPINKAKLTTSGPRLNTRAAG